MNWQNELANLFKETGREAREKAEGNSALQIGTIEKKSPLVISLFGGEAMYEADEIILTRTFSEYFCAKNNCVISGVHGIATCNGKHCTPDIKVGSKVLVAPVGSYTTIAVIDLVMGGD